MSFKIRISLILLDIFILYLNDIIVLNYILGVYFVDILLNINIWNIYKSTTKRKQLNSIYFGV